MMERAGARSECRPRAPLNQTGHMCFSSSFDLFGAVECIRDAELSRTTFCLVPVALKLHSIEKQRVYEMRHHGNAGRILVWFDLFKTKFRIKSGHFHIAPHSIGNYGI